MSTGRGTFAVADGPIVVTATFGPEDFALLDALRRRHYPAGRNQVPAHLTLFHHLPPSAAEELKRRLAAETRQVPPPGARLSRVLLRDDGVALAVDSPGLEDIRDRIAEAFASLLIPQDRTRWDPHVTIQAKAEPRVAAALHAELKRELVPRALAIAGLAAWRYRGGPWEPLASYRFEASRAGRRRRS